MWTHFASTLLSERNQIQKKTGCGIPKWAPLSDGHRGEAGIGRRPERDFDARGIPGLPQVVVLQVRWLCNFTLLNTNYCALPTVLSFSVNITLKSRPLKMKIFF